ncbi:MAG: sirohydrochlorin chelatase [Paracoccus sp. (in: a-proteobacteria)]
MSRPVIIVAHGQPSEPAPQQAAIEALAASVAPLAAGPVIGATLASPGALETALAQAPDALIYPMFMAAGWFTGKELPRRLALAGAGNAHILPPFGTDPGLANLCAATAGRAARDAGWEAFDITLLLIAHGSQQARASALGAMSMAGQLAPDFGQIVLGFIEEAPFLAEAARGLGPGTVALPFFATRAGHVTDDIPQALGAAGFTGICLPPIGLCPEVPALIADAIKRGDAAIAQARADA